MLRFLMLLIAGVIIQRVIAEQYGNTGPRLPRLDDDAVDVSMRI